MRRALCVGVLSAFLAALVSMPPNQESGLKKATNAVPPMVDRSKKTDQPRAFVRSRDESWEGPMPAGLAWRMNVNGFRSDLVLEREPAYRCLKRQVAFDIEQGCNLEPEDHETQSHSAWLESLKEK